jgi:FkbM family methyltransferase
MNIRVFSEGDTVFDVGANIGNKTQTFLSLGAKVICFEPQAQCVDALLERFSGNPLVTVVPAGLAEEEGRLPIQLCDQHVLSTFSHRWKTGRHAGHRWDTSAMVPVITLDKAIAMFGRPQYIKIDVEGYETNVLRGLTEPLDVLSFEFTKEFLDDAQVAVDYLIGLGMTEFTVAFGENDVFATQFWCEGAVLMNALRNHPASGLWGDIYARRRSDRVGFPVLGDMKV